MIRFSRHVSSVKIFALTVFIFQFLFINNAFPLVETDKEREEMNLILNKLNIKIEFAEKINVSDKHRLWFFVRSENYLGDQVNSQRTSKEARVYKYTFYTVLSDMRGSVLDSITEIKKYDRHLYDIFPADHYSDAVPYYDLNGKGNFAYAFYVVLGIHRPGEDNDPITEGLIKDYTKLSLFAIEDGKIKKVLNDFTKSLSLRNIGKDKCSNDRKRRTEHVRSKELFLSNRQTNGYFDFDVKVHDYFRDSCNSNNNEKSTEVYKLDGNVYRNANTAAVNVDKAVLFDTPDSKKPSKMYLVKGDYVIIRKRETVEDMEWVFVDFDSATLGKTLSKWMQANAVTPLFYGMAKK